METMAGTDVRTTATTSTSAATDIALLILRLGIGAAVLQAGLRKAVDFETTAGFMAAGGWRLPDLAAFMVTAAETLGGIGLLVGMLTPLAATAVTAAMLDAWAVNVSGAAFWSEPFNLPFLLAIGATTLLFAGAGRYSIDSRVASRFSWSTRTAVILLGVAVVAAIVTWVALNGTNPIHI
jgi:putative oxidoreductase